MKLNQSRLGLLAAGVMGLAVAGSAMADGFTKKYYEDYPVPKADDSQKKSGDEDKAAMPKLNVEAIANANARIAGAREEIDRAKHMIDARMAKLQAGFSMSADYRSAMTELGAAGDDADNIRTGIEKQLMSSNADYRHAVEQRDALAKIIAAGGLSESERLMLAQEKMDQSLVVMRIENDALNNDSKYKAAMKRQETATNKINSMRSDFDKTVKGDAELKTANDTIAEAKVNMSAAQAYLAAMEEAYNRAIDDYDYFNHPQTTNNYNVTTYPFGSYGYPWWGRFYGPPTIVRPAH